MCRADALLQKCGGVFLPGYWPLGLPLRLKAIDTAFHIPADADAASLADYHTTLRHFHIRCHAIGRFRWLPLPFSLISFHCCIRAFSYY